MFPDDVAMVRLGSVKPKRARLIDASLDTGDVTALNSSRLQESARNRLNNSRVFSLLEAHIRMRLTTGESAGGMPVAVKEVAEPAEEFECW